MPINNFPEKKYDIIVIDPPWEIKKIQRKVRPNQVKMDYPMMSIEEVLSVPITSIAKKKSIIFLWIIDKYLMYSKEIIEKWGFKYHLTMAWNKMNGLALYGFHRCTEFVVVGLRGNHEAYPRRPTIPTSFRMKSSYHSAKPDGFYTMLDVLEGDRIDIFARKQRNTLWGKPWDVWGGEIE